MQKEDDTPPTPGEGLADALVMTAFVTMAIINRIAAEHDLSLSLFRLLGILQDRRPRMTELADYLGLEKQTMSGLVARAEKRGLVAKAANAGDGRVTEVFLTQQGTQLFAQLRAEGQTALTPFIEGLDPPDRQLLEDLLQRLVGNRQD